MNMTENGMIIDIVPKFSNSDAEYCFRKYHNFDAYSRSQQALRGLLLFNIWLICAEHFYQISADVSESALQFRVGSLLLILLWMFLSLPKFQQPNIPIHPLFNIIYGVYLIVMHSYLSHQQINHLDPDTANHHEYSYLFYNGRWSLGDAMIFVLLCFNATLRFGQSASISGGYILLFTTMPFLLGYTSLLDYSLLLTPSMIILFAFYLLCLVSAQDIEMKLRIRFLKLSELGHALRRRDTLINSILPKDISVAIRKGDAQKLSAYHQNVSILFCSIVDFGRHSSISHAEDIVKLLIRIVSMFDRITSHFGVYKVENIADTYMCCGGLGLEQEQNYSPDEEGTPLEDPSIRIARTALAMRQASEYFNWRWPDGTPVTLKIGIHTGNVNAGVIGTRSYSYHLFGDAVNTASRMCSHSAPGLICLSKTTVKYIRAINKGIFQFRNRGKVNVKGKGELVLFWLDGCKEELSAVSSPEHVYYTNTRQDLSQNIGRFLEQAESTSSIAIRPFDLTFVNISPTPFCSCFHERRMREAALHNLETAEDEDLDVQQSNHSWSSAIVADASGWVYYNLTTPTFRYQIIRAHTRFVNWWRGRNSDKKEDRQENNSNHGNNNSNHSHNYQNDKMDSLKECSEEKLSDKSQKKSPSENNNNNNNGNHYSKLSPRLLIPGVNAKISPSDDVNNTPNQSLPDSDPNSNKTSVHRLISSKNFPSTSSLDSNVSTIGPLSSSISKYFQIDSNNSNNNNGNEQSRTQHPFSSGSHSNNNSTGNNPSIISQSNQVRRLSSSSNASVVSTHSSHQDAIAALTVRRLSSSETSAEGGPIMSAEDALMVNKLRKASNKPGTFFRLNTIHSGESSSLPATPKVTSRQPSVNPGLSPRTDIPPVEEVVQHAGSVSGKSSSGKSESMGGFFDRFLSRSSSISLSSSKSYSSRITISASIDDRENQDPTAISSKLHHRRDSKNSPPNVPLNSHQTQQSQLQSQQQIQQQQQSLLPPGISPTPPSSSHHLPKSIRPRFRRSISDPDDTLFTGKSSGSFDPTRARSFDITENNQEFLEGGVPGAEENEKKSSDQYVSGTIRKGSLMNLDFFLTKAGSKASSWVSSNSNDHVPTSSGKRERNPESAKAQEKRYDAFADHSGFQTQQISTSNSEILSDADRLEIHFQDTYNYDNVGQFKRVLLLVGLYQSFYCLLVVNTIQNILIAAILLLALLYLTIFPKCYNQFQIIGTVGTLILLVLHARQQHGGVRVDTISIIFTFALINIHTRIRFKFSCIITLIILIAILGRILVSPLRYPTWKIYGSYGYSVMVSIMTLFQSYVREKAIRENYKHLKILQDDSLKSQLLLENMLPNSEHAKQLLNGELVFDELHDVTLLYSDIKGFTPLSATMDSQVLTKLLNLIYSAFDRHLEHFGLYKVDTIGDAFVVVGGLPGYKSQDNHAMACLQFAFHMQNDMKIIRAACEVDIELRIGIHTGSVIGSVISLNKPRYLVWGSDTQVANAMESTGVPGSIHISNETVSVLNPTELQQLGITLTKRPPDENIQQYTESSYLASCNDIGYFFHDTWSHLRLTRTTGNGDLNLLVSPEYNESSIFEVMSTLAKQLLKVNPTEGKANPSNDDFDDFMIPNAPLSSPSRMSRRTRGDSIDESEFSTPIFQPRQRKEAYTNDDNTDTYRAATTDEDAIENNSEIQHATSRGFLHSASLMLRKLSIGGPQLSNVEDLTNSYSDINPESTAAQQTVLTRPNNKITFVERSTLQQDITRGQIIPATFQPVTIIWNKRFETRERNLIINNYNTGSTIGERFLLDNATLPSGNGNVSISISTPKRPSQGAQPQSQSQSQVASVSSTSSPINTSNRNIPWNTIRQTLDESSHSTRMI